MRRVGRRSSDHPRRASGRRLLLVGLLVAFLPGCAATPRTLPLGIAPEPERAGEIRARALGLARERPPDPEADERTFRAAVLQDWLAGRGPDQVDPALRQAWVRVRDQQLVRLEDEVVSHAFVAPYDAAPAYHEVTAGLIAIPLVELLRRFEPSREWGRNLCGYRGGELIVDRRDEAGLPVRQRERMVQAAPWYAPGMPDMDVDKQEVIDRDERAVTVSWEVTRSANGSVDLDVGYLAFRAVRFPGREATLVVFESVHRLDTGWLARALPEPLADASMLRALRQMFACHIRRYDHVLSAQRSAAGSSEMLSPPRGSPSRSTQARQLSSSAKP